MMADMPPEVSVVVPVYNGAAVLAGCLRAVLAQNIARRRYEVIVVDDGSQDASAEVARQFDVILVQQPNLGSTAARNAAIRQARGEWVASTDADCIPSRAWLASLLAAVQPEAGQLPALGAAGPILGYAAESAPARYIELTGGFDTEGHLRHPSYPYAPHGNVMYRRSALAAVGGLDERYTHYPGPDLHDRLRRAWNGPFHYAPRAVVMHRHPDSWRAYWSQQVRYGMGYAMFLIHHRTELPWEAAQEAGAWRAVFYTAFGALWPGKDDAALLRRGHFIKALGQRVGFVRTYWNRKERQRWSDAA
jgi:glycosyltransferase involved in cell wall biosynthesis